MLLWGLWLLGILMMAKVTVSVLKGKWVKLVLRGTSLMAGPAFDCVPDYLLSRLRWFHSGI